MAGTPLIRRSRRGATLSRQLTWGPPTLVNPTTYTITNDPATRSIIIPDGTDAIIVLGETITDWVGPIKAAQDSLIDITGGRNVVCIGGRINVQATPTATITTAVGASDTTLTVDSTAGFPTPGELRLEGEGISYTSTSATQFLGVTRNAFLPNTSAISSTTTHPVGSIVRVGEAARHAMFWHNQTGTVHIEGVLVDGVPNDGFRLYGTNGTIWQVQNCRIGPVINSDALGAGDGHPDAVQVIRGGADLRIDRVTALVTAGRGINFKGSDGGHVQTLSTLNDFEMVGVNPAGSYDLFADADTGTTHRLNNVWANPVAGTQISTLVASIKAQIGVVSPGEITDDFCPPGVAGTGYVTPGYYN